MEKNDVTAKLFCSKIEFNGISGFGSVQLLLMNADTKYYSLKVFFLSELPETPDVDISV